MKLFGYSETPGITQYLHLGYISATIPSNLEVRSPEYVKGGLISLIAGIILALLTWKRFKLLFSFGLIASGTGLFIIAFAPTEQLEWGEYKFVNPDSVTLFSSNLSEEINKRVKAGYPIPADVRVMQKEWHLRESQIQDAWFHDLRIEKNGEGGYTVISAAKDGIFDTNDDIKAKTKDLKDSIEKSFYR